MMLSCRKRYRSFTVSSCCCYNPVLSDITGALSDVLNWRRETERGRAEAERRGVDWDKAGRHRVILHFFPFQSEAWLPQGLRPPPIKVFPSVIKVIVTLEDKIGSWDKYWSSAGLPCGCQEQLFFWCLLQKMSFNDQDATCLSSISGIRSLEDRKGSWRFHLSSIFGVGSLEDRNGFRQESAF